MSDDFFDEFMNDPYMDEIGGGGDFRTIARAIVQPAYQGWQFGSNPKVFPYDGSKQAGIVAREKCAEYCQGDSSYPQAGMLTIVYGSDVPTHPEGAMDKDWYDFVPVFHSREKYTGQIDVKGEFPYDLVMNGLKQNRAVFCTAQWCELSRPIDNVREPKRNKEASKYAHRVYVVERVFKSREAAYEAAGKVASSEPKEDDFAGFGGQETQETKGADGLSQLALSGKWTIEGLRAQSDNILSVVFNAVKGEGTPSNEKMNLIQARDFACDSYAVILPNDFKFIWTPEILAEHSQQIHEAIAMATKGENTPNNEALNVQKARDFVCEALSVKVEDLKHLNLEVAF